MHHVDQAQLFQVDNVGGDDQVLTKKQKLLQKDPMIRSKKFKQEKASRAEIEKIKKLQQNMHTQSKTHTKSKKNDKLVGIWGDDGSVAIPNEIKELDEYIAPVVVTKVRPIKHVASTKLKVEKVEVALPGQSYHPDFESHQDVMAEAVAQVLEQEEIMKEMKEPISKGLSEETLQYIDQREDNDDSDVEVSEDDDEEEEYTDENGNIVKRKKSQETLTRTQRNKRSRHKQLLLEQKTNKDKKTLLKQINKYVLLDYAFCFPK
jgi:nucleolar protein 53